MLTVGHSQQLGPLSAAMQPTPRIADLAPPEPCGTDAPLGVEPAQVSVPSNPTSMDPASSPTAPILASSAPHPPTSHQDHPALPVQQSLSQPPLPAPDMSRTPNNPPNTQPIVAVSSETIDAGPSNRPADVSPAPPTTAKSMVTKKPRAPRKTPQWPPLNNLRGNKWAHARQWYLQTNGSQAAFEDYYKSMTPNERRVLLNLDLSGPDYTRLCVS
ncbi:hypothetical protein BD310DRAFT_983004 [Dichomitus squalens]|uniref:Uncharacterized protein n=1 Tax=Dichomitus squalens TaxID=114155 RepID=A0A4V2K662_9APHY|nr:hypothetical protein BD310DRAFT_983004 [Dichomitus squalens]